MRQGCQRSSTTRTQTHPDPGGLYFVSLSRWSSEKMHSHCYAYSLRHRLGITNRKLLSGSLGLNYIWYQDMLDDGCQDCVHEPSSHLCSWTSYMVASWHKTIEFSSANAEQQERWVQIYNLARSMSNLFLKTIGIMSMSVITEWSHLLE